MNSDPGFAFNDNHVPVIFGIHGPLRHRGPEAALGSEIGGVEHDNLVIDAHSVMLRVTRLG